MATDYLLAALCLVFAWLLAGRRGGGIWVAAFGVTSVAALAGGTAHGFRMPLGELWIWVWRATVLAIGGGSLLLIVAGVGAAIRSRASTRREGIQWMKAAIALSLVGLAVLLGKLSFHQHFNQNDLYHVIQMAGLYCLYRGALLLSESDKLSGTSR